MHILIIHQFYLNDDDPGGSRFNKFVEHWSNLGHKVTVIAGTVNYTTGKTHEKYKGKYITTENPRENVKVIRCHVSGSYNKNFLGRLLGYFSFNFSSTLALLKNDKPDIILVSSPPLFVGITGIIAKLIYKKPLIFEVRDLWPESAIDTGVLTNKFIIKLSYIVEKYCYKFADRINVLTPAFKEKIVEKKGINPNKIIYVPNGADTDLFFPEEIDSYIRKQYDLEKKFVITYTGAHGLANNLIYLMKLAHKIKHIDSSIQFMLIGDGMKKQELIDYKNEHGLKNVTLVDAQPKSKMPAFINASDVGIAILKKNDTFKTVYPNKIFDYMSCKKPILIGIEGIAREMIESNNAGMYLDQENIDNAIETILYFKNNKEKLNEMGNNGFNFVINNFERKKLSIKYLNYMKNI